MKSTFTFAFSLFIFVFLGCFGVHVGGCGGGCGGPLAGGLVYAWLVVLLCLSHRSRGYGNIILMVVYPLVVSIARIILLIYCGIVRQYAM